MRHLIATPALGSLLVTSVAAAATWPGPPPCAGTLQACVDAVPEGEVVELATDGPIEEALTITRSVTLRPAAGFSPVFGEDRVITVVNDDSTTVTIEGIGFGDEGVWARQEGAGPLVLSVVDTYVTLGPRCGRGWITIEGEPNTGPIHYEILRNDFRLDLSPRQAPSPAASGLFELCGGIWVKNRQGADDVGVIADNRIHGSAGNHGIFLEMEGSQDLEITGNELAGLFPCSLIAVTQEGAGSESDLLIANNLMTGNYSFDCLEATLIDAVLAVRIVGGEAEATIVNNTMAHNEAGAALDAVPAGAVLRGVVANNIFAFSELSGLFILGDGTAELVNDHNLVFGNLQNDYSPGPHTLTVDPQLVSTSDLRLSPDSPAIDAGDLAALPPALTTDAGGAPRVAGLTVDIGAYEHQGPDWIFGDGFERGGTGRWSSAVP